MKLGYRMFLAGIAVLFSTIAISQEVKPINCSTPIKQKVVSKRFEAKHAQPVKKQFKLEMKEEKLIKLNK